MYEYTDKVIRQMRRRFIRLFSGFKSTIAIRFDELNVIQASRTLYNELEKIALDGFLRIAEKAYKSQGFNESWFCSRSPALDKNDRLGWSADKAQRSSADVITSAWLMGILNEYDPVTKYVYLHEVERKRSRFEESIIASANPAEEVNTALRYWSNMVSQYAIEITDRATLRAYEDSGVERVVWRTVKDERRCKKCLERDGRVYRISEIPPKPHIGCRCWLLPYYG